MHTKGVTAAVGRDDLAPSGQAGGFQEWEAGDKFLRNQGRGSDRDSIVTQSSRVTKQIQAMFLEPLEPASFKCLEPGTWVCSLARPSKTIYFYQRNLGIVEPGGPQGRDPQSRAADVLPVVRGRD